MNKLIKVTNTKDFLSLVKDITPAGKVALSSQLLKQAKDDLTLLPSLKNLKDFLASQLRITPDVSLEKTLIDIEDLLMLTRITQAHELKASPKTKTPAERKQIQRLAHINPIKAIEIFKLYRHGHTKEPLTESGLEKYTKGLRDSESRKETSLDKLERTYEEAVIRHNELFVTRWLLIYKKTRDDKDEKCLKKYKNHFFLKLLDKFLDYAHNELFNRYPDASLELRREVAFWRVIAQYCKERKEQKNE